MSLSKPFGLLVAAVAVAVVGALVAVVPSGVRDQGTAPGPSARKNGVDSAGLAPSLGALPFSFEANHGQADHGVDFVARGPDYTVSLRASEVAIGLTPSNKHRASSGGGVVRMRLVGASPDVPAAPRNPLPGKVNYFVGNDPARWRAGIPTYAGVAYTGVYPGIDAVYYGKDQALEYDFVVAPGADPGAIALGFDGVEGLRIDHAGDLVLESGHGQLRQRAPRLYQEVDGTRRSVEGRFVAHGDDRVGFAVGPYDKTLPLVIDPVISYSTYLGGSQDENANSVGGGGIAVDPSGKIYVTGKTFSPDFPVTPGSHDEVGSGQEVFVAKIDPTATGAASLVYSTYLGGAGSDGVGDDPAIAVDAAGAAVVVGQTCSTDFPTTPDAAQPGYAGGPPGEGCDGFLTQLDASGSAPSYSTYLGGARGDGATEVALAAGRAYVTGATDSSDFPTTAGAYDRTNAAEDAFMAVVDPAADGPASLVYATYLGGGAADRAYGIAVDAAGAAYVSGDVGSTDFPVTPGSAQQSCVLTQNGQCIDAFVAKLTPDPDDPNAGGGDADDVVFSTYLGGPREERYARVAVDVAGSPYVTGWTGPGFPTTANAFQRTSAQSSRQLGPDAFMTKLDPAGASLVYSTYLSGETSDHGNGIDVDPAGNAFVVGTSRSIRFPTTPDALQRSATMNPDRFVTHDAFLAKIDPTKSGRASLVYSTFLGGNRYDWGMAIDVDGGAAHLTGYTASPAPSGGPAFPTTPGAFQTTNAGGLDGWDAFVTKIDGL